MIKELKRLSKVTSIIFKYRLHKVFAILNNCNTIQDIQENKLAATNSRLALEELGPIFIKFGQLLSTRHEMLPLEFIQELSKLQDRVTPFDTEVAKNIVSQQLGKPCDEIFTEFSSVAIASASVAQVHTAKLDNKEVVVKILRPNLKANIHQDISLLKFIVKFLIKLHSDFKRFKPDELVLELERVLEDEQDLLREAANASQIRRNFDDNTLLTIPKVYWAYTSKQVLTLEKIAGISINNIDELKEKNVNLELLAKRGVELFFTQVFEHCLFHGDLHPGNIFVDASKPDDPNFYAVDFGIVGSLGPVEQFYLAHNLWAFINRDYRKVAELHIESGWVDPSTRVDVFEAAIRTVSEPILELPVSEISFGKLLVNLFDVARSFNMQLQPQLLVFKKSLINVEGIAHKLDPDLNLWEVSEPFIKKWMENQLGLNGFYNKLKDKVPVWNKILLDSPELIYKLLKQSGSNMRTGQSAERKSTQANQQNSLSSIRGTLSTGYTSIFVIAMSLLLLVGFNYDYLLLIYNTYKFTINNTVLVLLLIYGVKNYFRSSVIRS